MNKKHESLEKKPQLVQNEAALEEARKKLSFLAGLKFNSPRICLKAKEIEEAIEDVYNVATHFNQHLKRFAHKNKQSEERFRLACLATSESIYDWDLGSNVVWRDQTYKQLFVGENEKGEDHEWFRNRIHPKEKSRLLESVKKALEDGYEFWKDEYQFMGKEGEFRIIQDSAYIMRDHHGKAVRIIGAMSDITERRKDELSAVRLAAIVESSDDAIVGINMKGLISSWNKGAETMYGYRNSEIIGEHISLIVPENKRHEIYDILARIESRQRVMHYETYRTRKDGTDIPVSISVSPIEDDKGKLIGTSVITRDISQKKAYERALRLSENRFRYASLATSDSIYDWNLKTNEVWRNETYQKLFCPGEPIGKDEKWFSTKLHPEDADRIITTVYEAIANPNCDNWKGYYRFKKVTGEFSYVEDSGFIIRNKERVALRIIGAMNDVTERIEFQKQLENINESLEQKVKNRTQELEENNRELVRLNEDLDSFVHSASHDLKVPIVNMEALVNMLDNNRLDDKTKEIVQKIETSIQRIQKTIANLSSATKARKNLYDDVQEIDVEQEIGVILDEMEQTIQDSEAETNFYYHIKPKIIFSQAGFSSIIRNLVSNAIKYSKIGEQPNILIEVGEEEHYYKISVVDQGLGIDLEKHGNKLFGIFKRLHDHVEGSGVGLYYVKRLLESNGGRIEVKSEVGVGTEFIVYFKKRRIRQQHD
ncbi:MAG: PAS domain S-box-containing protein [Luteibaculaceae bacterium]